MSKPSPHAGGARTYVTLVGLASLAILLQGVWAGLFVREGHDYTDSWVEVHARGAEVAIALTAIAFVVAVWKLRSRRDLVIGTLVMLVLLVVEAYLGGLIGDSPRITIIHFPLGMALLALAVWLPLRARTARR